jgi:septal ring factor EnvC (AmiA/AmiB activator)
MALLSFGFIIFLLLSKRAVYKLIEYDFKKSIERNSKLSETAIIGHFQKMQKYTAEMLERLDQEAHEQLEQATHHVSKLREQLKQVVSNQEALNSRLAELEQSNAELHNEIKKRDAIIERKSKQIGRLKGDKGDK